MPEDLSLDILMYKAIKTNFKPLWIKMLDDHQKDYNIGVKENILDIGCGYGILTDLVAKKFKARKTDAITLDINKQKIATEKFPQYNFYVLNVEKMNFDSNSYDFVFSRGSYRFWENKVKGFSEIFRVLKPGGFALIGGGFGHSNPKSVVKEARINLGKMTNTSGSDSKLPYPTRDELKNMIVKAGIKNFEFSSPDEPGMWISFKK
ncbi:MAG: class I SAM-dependent methyltransferase [Candidatus Muiribacteriota bacterium]